MVSAAAALLELAVLVPLGPNLRPQRAAAPGSGVPAPHPSLRPAIVLAGQTAPGRRGGENSWQLAVLDLTSGRERLLDEDRGVDDQVAWLGEHTIK